MEIVQVLKHMACPWQVPIKSLALPSWRSPSTIGVVLKAPEHSQDSLGESSPEYP